MISILESRENEIKEYRNKLDGMVDRYESRGSKMVLESEIIVLQSHLDHIQTLIRSYEIETRNIQNRKRARLYRTRCKEYNKYLKQLRKDINWISAHAKKRTVSTESGGEYTLDALIKDGDRAIAYGRKLQLETEDLADRTIKDLENTKDIAIDIAIMVNDQSQQLSNIDQSLAVLDSEMERATRKIKQIARRVMTDKYVNCLLIIIILTIVVIVVMQFVDVRYHIKKIRI